MSVKTEMGEIRNQADLADGLRQRIHEALHAALKIGRNNLRMTSAEVEVWISQQLGAINQQWASAVKARQDQVEQLHRDEHSTVKTKAK